MTETIDMPDFLARYDAGATVIDCREPGEYIQGHVPGARLVPMSRVSSMLDKVPEGGDVYVICASGNRSKSVADFLNGRGRRACSVNGGTSGWVAAGRPVATGTDPGDTHR